MNLNGKVTNPGELRTKITLKKRVITQDAGGSQVPAYTTIADVWAKWENAHGMEAVQASSNTALRSATVTVRYRNDVDETCVIVKGGQIWDIVSTDNIRERGEYIELRAQIPLAG